MSSKAPPDTRHVQKWMRSHGLTWDSEMEQKCSRMGIAFPEQIKLLSADEWEGFFGDDTVIMQRQARFAYERLLETGEFDPTKCTAQYANKRRRSENVHGGGGAASSRACTPAATKKTSARASAEAALLARIVELWNTKKGGQQTNEVKQATALAFQAGFECPDIVGAVRREAYSDVAFADKEKSRERLYLSIQKTISRYNILYNRGELDHLLDPELQGEEKVAVLSSKTTRVGARGKKAKAENSKVESESKPQHGEGGTEDPEPLEHADFTGDESEGGC